MTNYNARLTLILEQCLDEIERDGVSLADCVAKYPDREALEELLTTALRIRESAQAVHLSDKFRRDSVRRLKAKLPSRRGIWDGRWRRMVGLAASIALIATGGGGVGLVYASDLAVPGDALYPVDQKVEQVQVQWANESHALTLQADFLDERLDEAEQLAGEGDVEHLNEALRNYDQAAQALVDALTQSSVNDEEVLAQVDEALSNHEMRLQEVLDKVPEQARPGIERAIEASQNGRAHAQHALDNRGKPEGTPGNGPPENPGLNGQGKDKDNESDSEDQDDNGDNHPGQGKNQGPPDHAGPPDDKPGNDIETDD